MENEKKAGFSPLHLALAEPLARAVAAYYQDPENVRKFKEWLKENGKPEAEPLVYQQA